MDEETVVGLVREIQALQSELEDVEAKKAAGGLPHSIEESLSALANRPGGGAILFGLDEEGGFVPCTVYDVAQLQADLASRASDEMNPPVRVSFTLVDIEGCTVICAEVPECPPSERPCYVERQGLPNGAYVRVGNTNRRMTAEELTQFLGSVRDDFELEPAPNATLDDIAWDSVEEYRDAILERSPASAAGDADREALLRRAGGLVEADGVVRPTLAGIMLFGSDPQSFFPRYVVTITQFEGTSIGDGAGNGRRYRFDAEISGRLPDMTRDAVETVLSRIDRYPVIEGLVRRDVSEYPEEVVREGITNAVAHRSYAYRGTPIVVRIFSDRIEVRSPGILFGTVTLDTIEREQSTRNPRIMAALREHGLVEQRGTGVATMIAEMKSAGLSPPFFEEDGRSFVVTLRNSHLMSREALQWLQQFSELRLNNAQRLALAHLRSSPTLANRDYQRINDIDGPTATRQLRELVEANVVEMHSTRGGAYYTLTEGIAPPELPLVLDVDLEDSEERIIAIVRELGEARRRDIARAFYGRERLTDGELRHVGHLLQRMAASGRLIPEGERGGRVYSVPNAVGRGP